MRLEITAADHVMLSDLWERAPEITRSELLVAMTDANLLLQGELMQDLPRGAGGAAGLAGSIQREERVQDERVLGLVSTPLPYGEYVELGTRPHMPPIQPLVDWVEAKLGETGDAAVGAAFAIAKTIARRGTRPQPVWASTYRRVEAELRAKFDAAVQRILGRLAGVGA